MLFCARSGDEQAVNAVIVISNAPLSEIRLLNDEGQMPPPSAVFFYTDKKAVFRNNLRVLRQLGTWKNGTPPGLSERDTKAGFVLPRPAIRAGAVIALRPQPRNLLSFKRSIEHLYEKLTGSPFCPEAREAMRAERKKRRKESSRRKYRERRASAMNGDYSLDRIETYV